MVRGQRNPLHYELPKRLKQLRLAAGLSKRRLAELAGVSASAIVGIEDDTRVPLIDSTERLALALGVSPCWLVYGALGERPFRDKVPRSEQVLEAPQPAPREVRAKAALASAQVGARLQAAREQAGLSKKALADGAEMSRAMVLYIEEGQSMPSVAMVEQLARALGVAAGWMAYGIGEGPGG